MKNIQKMQMTRAICIFFLINHRGSKNESKYKGFREIDFQKESLYLINYNNFYGNRNELFLYKCGI